MQLFLFPQYLLGVLAVLFMVTAGGLSQAEAPADQAKQPGKESMLKTQTGEASFFGTGLDGEETASGEELDKNELVAAHPSWPLGTIARVTNLENGRSVKVRIIDRGPSKDNQREGVVIDLSVAAAKALGFVKDGKTDVRVEVLEWGKG